jgi:hypothetical protein
MRHLRSLLAGLLIAPAAWLLLAIGQPRTTTVFARWVERNAYRTTDLIGPIAYLAVAGLLIGLIACLRLSPAGPIAAGIIYIAGYTVMFINPLWGIRHIPRHLDLGIVDAEPRIPVTNGTLAILAVCLVVASANRDRWRRPEAPAVVSDADSTSFDQAAEPETVRVNGLSGGPTTLGQALIELDEAERTPLEQRIPKPPLPEFTATSQPPTVTGQPPSTTEEMSPRR